MSMTAYNARVTMHEAKWTDQEGSTVTFKLPMDETAEKQRNPFQKFTKRRKGRAGTRFAMVCYEVRNDCQGPMVYRDEAMLAGWNDSQTNGHTVKLWLCGDGMGHPFDGYERKKDQFLLVLLELDDDNEIIDQKVRERVESSSKRPSERVSYSAAMLCKNEGFWTWISEEEYGDSPVEVSNEEGARMWLCAALGIDSRAELDTDERKADNFHEKIRRPFLIWQGDY